MRPFFHSKERCDALWAEQKKWLGTPFAANNASLGYGVDCVELQHECFTAPAVAAFPRLKLPAYTMDYAKHTTRTQLLQFLLSAPELAGRFVMIPLSSTIIAGDLFGVRSGRVDHHLAAANGWGEVVHALQEAGVIRTKLNDKQFTDRVVYILRLMEEGS